MKKVLLTLIVSLAFCGSIFAQHESHWSEFNYFGYEQYGIMVAAVSIDNNMITENDNFEDYEVATFVGGECRGHMFLTHVSGDLYPYADMLQAYYNTTTSDMGQEVSFKLYDHANQIEYTFCTSSITVLTGEDYVMVFDGGELIHDYYDDPIILSFSSSFTKEIDPYTEDGGYYLIASPLNEAVNASDVIGLRTPDFDFYSFDQTQELEWINHRDEENYQLQPGAGYLYANSTGEDLIFVGAPYNGNGEVTITKQEGTNVEFSGWNLVGNPFAQTAYPDRAFYVMNAEGSEIEPAERDSVEVMEGIFVIANSSSETMTFSTTKPTQYKGQIVLNVTQNRGNVIDRAIVRFGQGDVLPKFMLNENNTKLCISKNNNEFAVVRSSKNGKLPVNFKPSQDGVYTISVNAQNVEVGYLHLIDHQEGVDVNLLANPSYRFEATTNDKTNRFELVFRTGSDIFKELVSKGGNTEDFGFYSDGEWIINNEGDAILQVVDLNGQIMSSKEINGCVSTHIEAAPGIYMLRLINGKDMKVQKVVIK